MKQEISTRFQLRGHHLAVFAIDYFGNKFYAGTLPSYNEHPKEELQKNNKPPKKYINDLDDLSNSSDFITAIYGKRMRDRLNLVWHILKTQPDFEVEIVDGLDSICRSNCPHLSFSCTEVTEGNEDQTTLEAYGLKVGKTYTARELVQKVIEFTQRTGIRSPRDTLLR